MDRADMDRRSRTERAEVTEGSENTQPPVISRRAALGTLIGGAWVTTLAPQLATAQAKPDKVDLAVLLRGLYQPVVDGPDLGLSTVDLSDGSYSTTKIYPVRGIPGHSDVLEAIGDFYVQFTGSLCAYDIPGGAMAMEFTGSNTVSVPDGAGGSYIQGTFDLNIVEARDAHRSFVGGHNLMVDNLHLLASGGADEFCVCLITR